MSEKYTNSIIDSAKKYLFKLQYLANNDNKTLHDIHLLEIINGIYQWADWYEVSESDKIKIRKIAVSGGEPTLYWDNFLEIATVGKEFAPDCELSMNTDGFRWRQLMEDPIAKQFDYIQLSRHHYDDKLNDEEVAIQVERV